MANIDPQTKKPGEPLLDVDNVRITTDYRLSRAMPATAASECVEDYLRQAPDHYSVTQALRYGETRGIGGSEKLAREIAVGKLGQKLEPPDFWRSVLRFFVAHPEMELEDVNPIVDFIHANKFAGDEVLT